MASEKPLTAPLAEREATGDAMVTGSGSVVLPAGVINPAVPIRNIRMKFAVLIGLIQVGEVSNRDIVETVLNLVSESESFIIMSTMALNLIHSALLSALRPHSAAAAAAVR